MDTISILIIWVAVIFSISLLWYIVYKYWIPPTDIIEETIPTAIEIIPITTVDQEEKI